MDWNFDGKVDAKDYVSYEHMVNTCTPKEGSQRGVKPSYQNTPAQANPSPWVLIGKLLLAFLAVPLLSLFALLVITMFLGGKN